MTKSTSEPRHVTVSKESNQWRLRVEHDPFWVKGIGCNVASGDRGENYIRMAQKMGANAVRTWGGATHEYLDLAHQHGLMVNLGVWFDPVRTHGGESFQPRETRARLKEKALTYIRRMKDHPAVLVWNLGNEVFAFTESAAEQRAFGGFLFDLIEAVHKEDPLHPVVYAGAGTRDLPHLIANVPNLDIVGVNTYDGVASTLRWMTDHAYDRPLLVTEFGPLGSWDRPKDGNRLPFDPFDHFKAHDYAQIWREIVASADRCLGGFAFALGESRNQDSLTWFNVNFGSRVRETYWTLYKLFTGKTPENSPPRITSFRLSRTENLNPCDEIEVLVSAYDPDGDPLTYDYFVTDIASDPLVVKPAHFFPVRVVHLAPGRARVGVPDRPGFYRVYAAVSDNAANVAIANHSIHVAAPLPSYSAPLSSRR